MPTSIFAASLYVALVAAAAAGLAADVRHAAAASLRVATFNVSLFGERAGDVLTRLATGDDAQARHVAEIVQRVRPDVMLVNEIDYDPQGDVLRVFCDKYLAVGQQVLELPGGAVEPIEFPHRYSAPSNTGVHSGCDLNRDGTVESAPGSDGYAGDAWGYGRYEGQYGMAILSRFPIDVGAVRTFRNFRWRDMPDARLPDDSARDAAGDWYPADAIAAFPLSSKSHWDVPILVANKRVHLLASHPTPPVYDGPEDCNGRRNHDEIRFWADYIAVDSPRGEYIYDDAGVKSHLPAGETFVILGDLNGDPHDGDGREGISLLLASPRLLKYEAPKSDGAAEQARLQGGANLTHKGDPHLDTCDPPDKPGPGNLRLDYVLPSADLQVNASGVFWPTANDRLFGLVGVHPFPSSDHRLVWVDLEL